MLTVCLGICTLVLAEHVVSFLEETAVQRTDVEMTVIGDEPLDKYKIIDDANKTALELPASNETISNASAVDSRYEQPGKIDRRNGSGPGIPMELFLQWWSIVRPFGNEVVSTPVFPWTVAVQNKNSLMDPHLCSGNILTRLYVLSTCRCLSDPTGSTITPLVPKPASIIMILAGVSILDMPLKEQLFYGQIRDAVEIALHPQCSITQKYDFAVIELEYYLYFTKRVLPLPDLFETFRILTSRHRRSLVMQKDEICQAAGWPSKQAFWTGEQERGQKINDFMILGQEKCSKGSSNHFVCAKLVGENPWKLVYGRFGDLGSGLVCQDRVTAILSHYSGETVVFSNLRVALSFLWKYYQDRNDIYTISSSLLPVVSSMMFVFAVQVPAITTHLNQAH